MTENKPQVKHLPSAKNKSTSNLHIYHLKKDLALLISQPMTLLIPYCKILQESMYFV